MMIRTGTFATDEEIAAVKSARNRDFQPLAARIGPKPTPKGESANEVVHAAALKHGLPEIDGFYGIDLSNGEFARF